MEIGNDKLNNLESELVKIAKFSEQEQHEYDLAHNVRRTYTYRNTIVKLLINEIYLQISLCNILSFITVSYFRNGNICYMKRKKRIKNLQNF